MCKQHTDTTKTSPARRRWRGAKRVTAIAGGGLMAALVLAGGGTSGDAAIPQEDPFGGLEVLGAAELAEKRGGFIDSALGITLSLGANIRTAINGKLVLETLVKFADTGATQVTQKPISAAAEIPGLTFLGSDGTAVAGVSVQNTTGPVTFTAGGTGVTVPAGFQGLVAQSDTGVVAAVTKITSEQFANLVINADPSTQIQQNLQFNIDVDGFSQLQKTVRFNATMAKFRDTMRSASLGALGVN